MPALPYSPPRTAYQNRADCLAARFGIGSRHWEAMREDLLEAGEDCDCIRAQLSQNDDHRVQMLSRLTELRHLDVIARKIAGD